VNTYERSILSDFLANYVFPGFEPPVLATAGQTTFTLSKAWNVTYDAPLAYVNGQRRAATFASSTAVTISPAAALNDHVGILVVPGGAAGYLPRNGGTLLSNLNADGFRIDNLGPATLGHQPVRRDQVEGLAAAAGDASYLRRDGTNSPSADIAFAGRTITGIRNAAAAQEPVAKSQLDALDAAIDTRIDGVDGSLASLDGRIDVLEAVVASSDLIVSGGTTAISATGSWMVSYYGHRADTYSDTTFDLRLTSSVRGHVRIAAGAIVEHHSQQIDQELKRRIDSPFTFEFGSQGVTNPANPVTITTGPTVNLGSGANSRGAITLHAMVWKL
jgi:hypothetical protein